MYILCMYVYINYIVVVYIFTFPSNIYLSVISVLATCNGKFVIAESATKRVVALANYDQNNPIPVRAHHTALLRRCRP